MTTHRAALDDFLATMEYPAVRDDLLREAVRAGIDIELLATLQRLPERTYDSRRQIRHELTADPEMASLA